MKRAALLTNGHFTRNECFNSKSAGNRDRIFDPFIQLKEQLLQHKVELLTEDLIESDKADFCIAWEAPRLKMDASTKQRTLLWLSEVESVNILNSSLENHFGYAAVATWRKDFCDERYCYFVAYPQNIHFDPGVFSNERPYFAAMICGNKDSKHPHELYSLRRKIVSWYNNHAAGDLLLYGSNWEKFPAGGVKFYSILNRLGLYKIFKRPPLIWKGTLANKNEILQRCEFNFCPENIARPWATSEKIFDAMTCGAIPVYCGDSMISKVVPADIFVDLNSFDSLDNLNFFLKNLDSVSKCKIRENIKAFLESSLAREVSAENWAKNIIRILAYKNLL